MLIAIISAIIAAIVVLAIIAVVVTLRTHNKTLHAGSSKDVSQLENIGVSTTSSPDQTGAQDIHVSQESDTQAVKKPGDSLSRRFAVLGGLSVVVFGVLTARLWSVQVMSSDEYVSEAEKNLFTTVSTPAPRGCIYDTAGRALVINKASQTVLADADTLDDNDVMRRLSAILGIPASIVRQRINDTSAGAQNRRVVASDVRLRDIAFIAEHADAFSGVFTETRTQREYPYGALAAHVVGYTGSPTESMLEETVEGRVIESTDTVGLAGLESYYDALLSGDRGERKVTVDASGNVINVVSETAPTKGNDIYLALSASAQYVADEALANLIAPDGVIGEGKGVAGAIIGLDVRDGSVIVMSSYPTFDPTNFTGSISQNIWELYASDAAYAPLNNRVVNGQYAAASTYKAFTAMAGLDYGIAIPDETYWTCGGSWDGFGSGTVQYCWDHDGHGTLNLYEGIVHSCDVVFYEIAKKFYNLGPEGSGELSETALQDYLTKFNFGAETGIDLEAESVGRIPTPEWKAEQWRNVPSEAQWRGGDYTNMIIGQGDVLVTPLQLAVAYGGIATGRLMRPHLLKEVRNAQGEVVLTVEPEVLSTLDVDQDHLEYVRSALRGVVTSNDEVSAAFNAQGVTPAGKSGTAEHSDTEDDAWYVAYAPYDDPKYVVACIIEQGGGGAAVAAPLVAQVLGEIMRFDGGDQGKVNRVAGSTGQSIDMGYSSGSSRTD